MNLLDKIVAHKTEELEIRKLMVPVDEIVSSRYFDRNCLSLKESLLSENSSGIIAEFKRKSPSKGYINKDAEILTVVKGYERSGAAGLSILTDNPFFGGNTDDLAIARSSMLPILRKDFIIDPYQILTTKALGADVILLIAAILSKDQVKDFSLSAKKLGLEVILEIHDQSELGHICEHVDIIGINNRNLKTFKVDTIHALKLSKLIPAGFLKIAESGIHSPEMITMFKDAGFNGFLIGELFMRQPDPAEALKEFIKRLK